MIRRLLLHATALVAGVVIGAALVLASGTAPAITSPSPEPSPTPSPIPTPETTPPGPAAAPTPAVVPETDGALLLVWTPGGLPDRFAAEVAAIQGAADVTEVLAGRLDLTSSHGADGTVVDDHLAGWAIPLDAIAVDPTTFEPFVPTGQRPVLDRLEPGTVILGETSAALRGVGVGGRLTLSAGTVHTVVGILDDATVGAAEVVLHHDDPLATAMRPRYVLLRHERDRGEVEGAIRHLAGSRPVRVRAPGETPYLRHGDAVLPQAIVKERYGEFRYRPPGGAERAFEVDPQWVDAFIVTRQVPVLGQVTCHRAAIASLDAVLRDLDRRGLAHTVDPAGYEGCWNPRLISVDGDLSRHSWGIAVDLNARGNPTGTGSGQHEELVELFTAAGWGWGGTWLVPDPMHFELVDEPWLPVKVRP